MIFLINMPALKFVSDLVATEQTRFVILESKIVSCVGEISFTASASYMNQTNYLRNLRLPQKLALLSIL